MKRRELILLALAAPISLFLPQVQVEPAQWGGTVEYNCDIGESALGYWYVSAPSLLYVHWHYRENGRIKVQPDQAFITEASRVVGWFINTGYQQLRRVVWSSTMPAWNTGEGTCV